jgi:hypothetical protein
LLQLVLGTRPIRELITVQQAGPVAPGDLLEVGQHGGEGWRTVVVGLRHGPEPRAQTTCARVAIERCGIGQ